MSWLTDRRGRDQFVIQHDRQHSVCWNDPKKGCAEVSSDPPTCMRLPPRTCMHLRRVRSWAATSPLRCANACTACVQVYFSRSAPTEWSPLPLVWSPQGTYVCSLHPPLGAALWISKANGCAALVATPVDAPAAGEPLLDLCCRVMCVVPRRGVLRTGGILFSLHPHAPTIDPHRRAASTVLGSGHRCARGSAEPLHK
jgi:hypothetical protein